MMLKLVFPEYSLAGHTFPDPSRFDQDSNFLAVPVYSVWCPKFKTDLKIKF